MLRWGDGELSYLSGKERTTGDPALEHALWGSSFRSMPRLTKLTFRLSLVRIVSPVKGILLRIPGLCRTENLPKLPSFKVNPSVPRLLSRVSSSALKTASMIISACFFVGTANAC